MPDNGGEACTVVMSVGAPIATTHAGSRRAASISTRCPPADVPIAQIGVSGPTCARNASYAASVSATLCAPRVYVVDQVV
jgi:hypothetical protein